jgi:hypothetical protein
MWRYPRALLQSVPILNRKIAAADPFCVELVCQRENSSKEIPSAADEYFIELIK